MHILIRLFLAASLAPAVALVAFNYPATHSIEHVDDYSGTKISDPYRWMEELDSKETKAWVQAQNAFTAAELAKMPKRALVKQRLTELWNYSRTGLPFKEAQWYFFTKNDGLQNQSPLYVQEGLTGTPRLLLDPNTLAQDGTVALAVHFPSPDGKWLGYGLATGGSDWRVLHLRDVATGQDAPDMVKWAKFTGMSWTHDSRGFFYARYPQPAGGDSKVFSPVGAPENLLSHGGHLTGGGPVDFRTAQSSLAEFRGSVSPDGRYLIISISQPGQLGNSVYYRDLVDPLHPRFDQPVVKLIDGFESSYGFLGNQDRRFFFSTDQAAPRGKIVAFDLDAPAGTPAATVGARG